MENHCKNNINLLQSKCRQWLRLMLPKKRAKLDNEDDRDVIILKSFWWMLNFTKFLSFTSRLRYLKLRNTHLYSFEGYPLTLQKRIKQYNSTHNVLKHILELLRRHITLDSVRNYHQVKLSQFTCSSSLTFHTTRYIQKTRRILFVAISTILE